MDKKPIDKIPLNPKDKMPIKPIDKAAIDKAAQEHIDRIKDIRFQRKQKLKYIRQLNMEALKQRHLKKLTILHSNDLHGDFLAAEVDSELVGGVSMLSGYIHKVKNEEENVIYAIAGDMLRGSIIATIGNHEVDYGFSHLLFIEKCAEFPIINANMYLNVNGTRLFDSHIVLDVGGMKILFIGVLTEEVLASTKQEELIGKLIDVRDAADEVRKVVDAYRTIDIDLTVLLTHIGFDKDQELAADLGAAHTYRF